MALEQREMQAELRGQPQAEAAGAARVAQAGCGCRVQHQLMWVAAGAACDKRLLEQRGTRAEAAGSASGGGSGCCQSCRGSSVRRMALEQREMQAELRGQPQAEAAGALAARVAQAGVGCRVQQQLRSVAAGAAYDKRLLEQRGTRAEAAGSASGGGSGCCSSRSLWAWRAAAALLPRERCERDGAGAARNAGRECETGLRLRLQEQVDLHRLVMCVVCSSSSDQLLQE